MIAPDSPAGELTPLSEKELMAVVALWKKSNRQFVARFGGQSMRPTIPEGTPLTLRCGDMDAAVGDIVAFQCGDRLIVHRVAAAVGSYLLTCGDAEALPDPFAVPRTEILARVVAMEPYGERLPPAPRKLVRSVVLRACQWIARIFGVRATARLIGFARLVSGRIGTMSDDRRS